MDNKKMIGTLIAVVIISVAVFAAGCVEPTEKVGEQVTVMIAYTPNVGYAPFYVAAANGYYNEEGLNVDFQYATEGAPGVLKQLAANKVEFGYGGDSAVVTGIAQEMPVVAVQRIIQKNLFGIFSNEDLEIDDPEKLAGKKIALPAPSGAVPTITKIILKEVGMDFAQIQPLYVGGAIISTHLSGEADAFGGYLPQKIVAETISSKKMNEINASDYTTIGITYLYTSEKMVDEQPEIVKKFVIATQKGLEYSIEHPENAVNAYIKYDPDAVEKKDLHMVIWKAMVERGFDRTPDGKVIFHLPSEDNWAEKQDQMFDVDAINKKTDVNKMYTDEFVKTVLK